MFLPEHRVFSSTLQVSRIDLAAWLRDKFDTPFLGDLRKGLGANVSRHCGEDNGRGETWVATEYGLGSVIAIEITAEYSKGGIVEVRVRVCGCVHKTASEAFDWETRCKG